MTWVLFVAYASSGGYVNLETTRGLASRADCMSEGRAARAELTTRGYRDIEFKCVKEKR